MLRWDSALGRDNPVAAKPEPSTANSLLPNSIGDLWERLHRRQPASIAVGGMNGASRF